MKSRFRRLLGAATLAGALLSPQLHADDIDLYTGGEAATGAQTNVLLVLDNSTNWAASGSDGAKIGMSEMLAIKEVVGTLGDNVNVGLLLGTTQSGGYVRFSIREMSGTNRTAFQTMLQTSYDRFGGDGENSDKVNAADISFGSMLNAAFRYFNGLPVFNDRNPTKPLDLRDFNGNANDAAMQPSFPSGLGGYSLADSTTTTYSPPSTAASGCAKNFIIFIGNGYDKADSLTNLSTAAALVGVTDASIVSNVSGGDNDRGADEWTRFMYTYGVKSTVDDPKSTTSPKAKLVNKIATHGEFPLSVM
ncbi:MAG: hypothetical protein Q8K23_22645 [Sulfuritalea sp.]|nr:hypothetical protein [Sulfuritalea sp.]